MAEQDKDELARLLGEMSGSDHQQEADRDAAEERMGTAGNSPAAPEHNIGEADAWSALPPPVPLKMGLPKTNVVAPGASEGQKPPQVTRPAIAESKRPAQPAEAETAQQELVEESADAVPDDDDAVIVPRAPDEFLAHRPKRTPIMRQHLVKTLAFRQTIIPILLTVGVLSLAIVALGFVSDAESPFAGFRQWWFSLPVAVIGLAFLGFGVVTVLQVRHQMARVPNRK